MNFIILVSLFLLFYSYHHPLAIILIGVFGALGGTRTPNLLIRSQMLYPLSYKRWDA